MVRKYLAILFCLVVIIFMSCLRSKTTGTHTSGKRIYTVWASPPETVIVVTMRQDSTLEFYFNRDEWFRSAAQTISDSSSLGMYRVLIDSLEKHDGLIQFEKLLRIDEKQLNLSRTTQKIFDSLLVAGHVWIKYDNGTYVANVHTYSVSDSKGETVYFEDDGNGRLLYVTAKATND